MNEFLNQKEVKRSIVVVLILLSVFLLAKSINELKINGTIGKTQFSNTISVSGEGKISAVPDVARFSFSVREEAKTVKSAQDNVSQTVSGILDKFDDMEIDENDIKTVSYNVYPKYEYYTRREICPAGLYCPPTSERTLVGYEVNQTISIKVKNLEEVGETLNFLGSQDIDNLNGPSFEIENREELMRDARKLAINDAKEKAKELSKDLGVKINKIISFSEGRNFGISEARFAPSVTMDSSFGVGGSAEPEIPAGETDIVSNVEIIYEIR